jgi:hypothetical protein
MRRPCAIWPDVNRSDDLADDEELGTAEVVDWPYAILTLLTMTKEPTSP